MSSRDWHVLTVPPIDDFAGMTPLSAFLSPPVSSDAVADPKRLASEVRQFRERLDWVEGAVGALQQARGEAMWDGDFRHEPYVGALPWQPGEALYLVVKQENNGTCFVISQDSPVPQRRNESVFAYVVVPGNSGS